MESAVRRPVDRMRKRQNQKAKRGAALLCLVAVFLLEAPFARAAWLASAAGCCTPNHCSIPAHHHKNAPDRNEMLMNCGHDLSEMSECKISCRKTSEGT